MIEYKTAYSFSEQEGGGGYFPLDEKLGIDKRHTPGCQYLLSSFTGREAHEKSVARFHEIFRPDATQLISMRKSLDMDAELGERLESLRQEEIRQLFEKKQLIHPSGHPVVALRAFPDRQRPNTLLKAAQILGMDDRAPSGYLQEQV